MKCTKNKSYPLLLNTLFFLLCFFYSRREVRKCLIFIMYLMKAKGIILIKMVLRTFLPSEQSYHYTAILTKITTKNTTNKLTTNNYKNTNQNNYKTK